MSETKDVSSWVAKEQEQLANSSLRLALLAIIKQHQDEGIYGYLIGETLFNATGGEMDGTKATFYAILRRLQRDGLIDSNLGESTSGPARKYYFLTPKGERAYHALWANWEYYYKLLERLVKLI